VENQEENTHEEPERVKLPGWWLTGEAAHDTEGREGSMVDFAAKLRDRLGPLKEEESAARGAHTEGIWGELELRDVRGREEGEGEGRREKWSAIAIAQQEQEQNARGREWDASRRLNCQKRKNKRNGAGEQ